MLCKEYGSSQAKLIHLQSTVGEHHVKVLLSAAAVRQTLSAATWACAFPNMQKVSHYTD